MAKRKRVWPEWWEWELDISDHANEYMPVREFTEIDLRRMMEQRTIAPISRKDDGASKCTFGANPGRSSWNR